MFPGDIRHVGRMFKQQACRQRGGKSEEYFCENGRKQWWPINTGRISQRLLARWGAVENVGSLISARYIRRWRFCIVFLINCHHTFVVHSFTWRKHITLFKMVRQKILKLLIKFSSINQTIHQIIIHFQFLISLFQFTKLEWNFNYEFQIIETFWILEDF